MTDQTDTSAFDGEISPSRSAARLLVEAVGRPARTILMVPGMPIRIGRADDLELSLDDQRVSREHAVLRYDGRSVTLEDLNSSNGTWIGERKVQGSVALAAGTTFRVGSTQLVLLLPDRAVRPTNAKPFDAADVIAVDPVTEALFELVKRVGPSDLTVLIQGETGTGKEVVARTIHQCSARASGPFVAVNCSTLPDALADDTFFGHDDDGATRRPGAFESAAGGTLLLDEVGELSAVSQARLLRALQERVSARGGVSRALTENVRVVATTNRDLAKEVSAGRFREDLYFRLNGVTIDVPPLRQRSKDIPAHVRRVLDERGGQVTLGTGVAAVLAAHRWPGNLRELRNAISGALLLAQDGVLKVEHLPTTVRGEGPSPDASVSALRERVDETERKVIITALESTGWNQSRAARVLGISRRALIYKMERYGLKPLPNGQRNA